MLTTQVAAAARGVTVPVAITPVVTGAGAAGTAGLVAAQQQLGTATLASTTALRAQERAVASVSAQELAAAKASKAAAVAASEEAAARRAAAASAVAHQRSLSQVSRGAAASALTFAGLRGATLAATGPFLAGTAAVVGFGKAIQTATSFNQELAVFAATSGATADQMLRVSEAAKSLGRDITLPGVTAGDAAEAMTEFARAGLSVNNAIAAARGGLQLATAAQLSNAEAVELSANALNAFGLAGNQAVRVADVLANAANEAQGGIGDMALALRQSAAAARLVGVSFEDTSALLTLLARNGLTGSDAGTALRTAFLRLINPSKQARDVLRELNVELRDQAGNIRPEVFAEFITAQQGLTRAQQDANAAIVFGQDAIRALAILGREGTAGLESITTALGEQGTAARIAGARMTGLAGETANLSNQLDTLGLTIGQAATPALEGIVRELADLAGAANAAAEEVGDLKAAFDDLPGPDTSDFLSSLKEGLIEGLELQVPAFRFVNIFKDNAEKAGKDIGDAGADLRSAIEDSGRNAARGAKGFDDQIVAGLDAAFAGVRAAIAAKTREVRAALIQGVESASGRQAGLEEEADRLAAQGASLSQQRANLERQAAAQAKIIETAGPDAQGVLLEARRRAQAKLAQINNQIGAIDAQVANDQRQAQEEARRVREATKRDSDRAFLDAQADARSRQERLITRAEDTPALTDDIRRQEQLRTLIQKQIASLKASAVDEQAKQSALRALRAARDATTDEIRRLRETDRRQRQEQREQVQEELESAQIALGESILDLTGNKNPLLRALDAAVKDARKEKAAAKKGSVAALEAQTEINNLLTRRKELLEEAAKEAEEGTAGGTSLVDLFNRAQEIVSGAGNVGFTSTSLRGLPANQQIKAEVQERLNIVNDPAAAAAARQVAATDRLITAIDQLTQALTGNTASGTPITRREQNGWRNLTQETRFYFQRQARQMVEQGLVG